MLITAPEVQAIFGEVAAHHSPLDPFNFEPVAEALNALVDRKLFGLAGERGPVGVDGRAARAPELAVVGTCRICGCTDAKGCLMHLGAGFYRTCSWVNDQHTLCSNPDCIATAAVPAAPRLPAA